ncbi:hypothetical protein B0T16DRAFT_398650 [Cercophora newfieldiana]|uniref:C2H2-type domain-containing protein n=1 Tax=Cercophora newfieldiana TaxID=92897 RepID=A0AA39YP94_9PEZI|nr:hypothetical protein B0T16DRAFT_398650 [Cercophora newfieldiana]
MDSENTLVGTESTAAPAAHDDPNNSRAPKRARETTPVPSPASIGDLSPAKIARLVGYTRQSHSPLTGATALQQKRRRVDDQAQGQPETSPNLTHQVLAELMSGATAAMSRPQDVGQVTGQSAVEAAAAAAARALGTVQIPTDTSPDMHDISPQSAVSAGSGASMEDGESQVVHSPGPMDVDGRGYTQQPDAPMEDKAASSLSYPGLGTPMSGPGAPQRGMSLPMTNSQNPDLTPRSPSSKKHKCPYCETEFTRHHNLKSHLLTHSQEKPYVCQQCQMRFRRLHDLKRHSKLHTGEKPHICPRCDRKFARGDALARHSKGAGGCAGRRPSLGSYGGDEDYDGSAVDGDDSAMAGVLYDTSAETSMTEEERRRLSMPSIKAQHVAGQAGQEGFANHSNTYPPTGARPAGGLYPPNVDRGSTSSTTSPTVPNSHTPHTSISSVPLSAGSSSMYSQSGMTESPKPLSPGATQANQAGQKRTSTQQSASGLSLPTHGNAAVPSAGRGRGRGSSGAGARQASNGTGPESSNLFAGDPGLWALFHNLEEKVKKLTADLEAKTNRETQLMEKVALQDHSIAALQAEVAGLRHQLSGPPQDDTASQE